MRSVMIAVLGFTLFFSIPANAGIPGIWSSNCKAGKDGFIIESAENGKFQLIMCAGFKCIPMPGFRKPINLHSDSRINVISDTELTINDKTFHQCDSYSEVEFKDSVNDKQIKKNIVGKWKKTKTIKKGIELHSRGNLFFTKNGEVNPHQKHNKLSYVVKEHQLILKSDSNNTETIYNVKSITDKELIIEKSQNRWQELGVYERADLKIDADWLNDRLFIWVQPNRWTNIEKKWFDLRPADSYEQNKCEFFFFGKNGEYSALSTQACYRKKGDKTVHIDTSNKILGLFMNFGEWRVDSNVIYTNSTASKHYYQRPAEIGRKSEKKFFTDASYPDTLHPYQQIDLKDVPEYLSMHKKAKQIIKGK